MCLYVIPQALHSHMFFKVSVAAKQRPIHFFAGTYVMVYVFIGSTCSHTFQYSRHTSVNVPHKLATTLHGSRSQYLRQHDEKQYNWMFFVCRIATESC